MTKILLIGPQGSGKSTQAQILAKRLDLPKISTGDIFRELAKGQSEEGLRIREISSAGHLIDDETTAEIVKAILSKEDCKDGFVLDGYPRNIQQKDLFDPGFDKVFYLRVPDEEVIKRLTARGREDDSPEAIKTRLRLYYEQTVPLLDYYKSQGILVEIEGRGSIFDIENEINKHI